MNFTAQFNRQSHEVVLLLPFLALITTLSASTNNDLGLQGCGLYSFSGSVGLKGTSFYLEINKDTYSAYKIFFDKNENEILAPYYKKPLIGQIKITHINATILEGRNLLNLNYTTQNFFSTSMNTGLSLLEKADCEKHKDNIEN